MAHFCKFAMVLSLLAGMGGAAQADDKDVARWQLPANPLLCQGDFFVRNWMMMPAISPLPLSAEKSADIYKEPTYKGKPLYGCFLLGNSCHPWFHFAIDDEANAIYIDTNRNGDLTDDSPVNWAEVVEEDKVMVCKGNFFIDVPYILEDGKPSEMPVCLNAFRPKGESKLYVATYASRSGRLNFQGKSYNVAAINFQNRGLWVSDPAKVDGWAPFLLIDCNGDGTFRPINIQKTFHFGKPMQFFGQWVHFHCNLDGSVITVRTCPEPPEAKKPPMKKAGDKAIDFEMQMPDGSMLRLADQRGKVVVVDFWATWCGPCQAALPNVEKLWQRVKSNPKVTFWALCVSDEKKAFDKWIQEKGGQFSFPIGYDPAGTSKDGKGQMFQWGINAIPTTYVIDPQGVITEGFSGFTPENEAKLVAALEKLGIKVQ